MAAETLGAADCSTSGCHGGAGDKSSQFVTWSQHDVHARSFAALTTSRSARMSEALSITDASVSPRCVVCHAPLATVDPALLGAGVEPSEGVSCVSCHNLPGGWIRGHTRSDWTHADRVSAGMRDLNDLYTRANTCVACHQNIDPEIVGTGHHPALVFEMDGQTQDEPRHWRDPAAGIGAQAWFVGQAVALREVSWALLNGRAEPARSVPVADSLSWLLDRSGLDFKEQPFGEAGNGPDALASTVEKADLLAKRAARSWDPSFAPTALRRLSSTGADFIPGASPHLVQASRADRLVLALDRLLSAMPAPSRPAGASQSLDRLFHLAQSQPDFDPAAFAKELSRFSGALGVSVSAGP
ncbi:MAG TPA: multiheme c-type cytochrome [Opitutaceae bacterium]|nr:multiheme c-type cytochrome [Opitutaceae bacterium]